MLYVSGKGYSKVKTARKATGNHLGYFPYRRDSHRRLLRGWDVLQHWPVAAVLRRRLPPAEGWEPLTCYYSRIQEEKEEEEEEEAVCIREHTLNSSLTC